MRLTCLLLFFIFTNKLTGFSQTKTFNDSYTTPSGNFEGVTLTLKPDLSFSYSFRGHTSSDTSAGMYFLKDDTIFLHYHFNNYDSVLNDAKTNNRPIPVDLQLIANRTSMHRPVQLLVKGNKLYYLDEKVGEIKTYKYKNKTKELFLKKQ